MAGVVWLPAQPPEVRGLAKGMAHGNVCLNRAAVVTALIVAAQFCSYTYIVPLLDRVVGISRPRIPALLFLFGAAGVAGTAIAGWAGQQPVVLAFLAAIGIVASQALMAFGPPLPALAWLEMIAWGISIAMLIIGLQGWVLELAPEQPDAASALYVAAFNIGIGAGAMIGGLVLEAGSYRSVLWTGIGLGVLACAALAMPCHGLFRSVLEDGP
jgi:predicted MFS family arabinose efflux permease